MVINAIVIVIAFWVAFEGFMAFSKKQEA